MLDPGRRTGNDRSAVEIVAEIHSPANYLGAVLHDLQSHTRLFLGIRREANAVVFNSENNIAIGRGQPDRNVPRLRVLDDVMHGFLRDPEEVDSQLVFHVGTTWFI